MKPFFTISFFFLSLFCNAQSWTWVKHNDSLFMKSGSDSIYIDSFSQFLTSYWGNIKGSISNQADLQTSFSGKQATLVSGTNIKTINGSSVLGSGDLVVTGSGASWGSITGTLSSQTDLQTALDGKQAAGSYVPQSTTVNGHALSANITVTAADVGLGNVTNESKATMFTNATFTGTFAVAAGSISNAALANGAVANLSGTNTGDQTTISGNAGTATTLQTTRNINGIAFNGSADIVTEQLITLTSAYTLTSQTAAQKLFNSTTNGAITLTGNKTYWFECFFSLTSMSATSGSFGFALGGTATLTRQGWWSLGSKTALATASTQQGTYNTAANTTLATANTTTTGHMRVWGKIVVGTGGTLIPSVSLGIAAAAIVGNDSYFKIFEVGSNTVQFVGNWN